MIPIFLYPVISSAQLDAVNKFIELNFTAVTRLRVNCTFINQPKEGEKVCTIEVRPECKKDTFTSKGSAYDSSFVEVVVDGISMENTYKFCFLLTGTNDTTKVNVEGQYTLSGK